MIHVKIWLKMRLLDRLKLEISVRLDVVFFGPLPVFNAHHPMLDCCDMNSNLPSRYHQNQKYGAYETRTDYLKA